MVFLLLVLAILAFLVWWHDFFPSETYAEAVQVKREWKVDRYGTKDGKWQVHVTFKNQGISSGDTCAGWVTKGQWVGLETEAFRPRPAQTSKEVKDAVRRLNNGFKSTDQLGPGEHFTCSNQDAATATIDTKVRHITGNVIGKLCIKAMQPRSQKEEKVRAYCQDQVTAFVNHLRTRHGSDPRSQAVIRTWNGTVHLFYESASGARYNRSTGCLYVNPTIDASRPRLHTKILHELAHATPNNHDERWRDAFAFFLKIATAELGWECELRCGACQKYGLCSKAFCPKCTWLDGDPARCPKPHYEFKDCAICETSS